MWYRSTDLIAACRVVSCGSSCAAATHADGSSRVVSERYCKYNDLALVR